MQIVAEPGSPAAAPHRRCSPAHPDLDGADGRQRGLQREHRCRKGAAAPAGRGRNPVVRRRPGAEGADVAEVVDRAQAEIYDVADRRLSETLWRLRSAATTMDEIDAIASSGGLARGG